MFFITHEYRDEKSREKSEKNFFPETHEYRVQKTMEKNHLDKVQKYVFNKHTNIVIKKSEKNREKNFF